MPRHCADNRCELRNLAGFPLFLMALLVAVLSSKGPSVLVNAFGYDLHRGWQYEYDCLCEPVRNAWRSGLIWRHASGLPACCPDGL